jgi:flagellar hook protein FlgE
MARSLFTALSGMRANQQWIDVIGNNLANSNTPGYKASRASFSSAFAQTLQFASTPSTGLGGRNPNQIGLGVGEVRAQRSFSQGALTSTGRIFDLALEGNGFFSLRGNGERFFSRVGTFGLDARQNLVDQNTGFMVLDRGGEPIALDVDSLFPPQATSMVDIKGNLPAVVEGPVAEVLTSQNPLRDGTEASLTTTVAGPTYAGLTPGAAYTTALIVNVGPPQQVTLIADAGGNIDQVDVIAALDALEGVSAAANGNLIDVVSDRTGEHVSLKFVPGSPNDLTSVIGMPTTLVTGSDVPASAATQLNNLTAVVDDYVPGDTLVIEGVDTDGAPINAVFTYGAANDGETLNDLVTFLDGLYAQATVTLNTNGQLVVTADTPGETELLLSVSDGAANTGSAEWLTHSVSVTTEGTAPDSVVISTAAFDNAGVAHALTLTFERQANDSWNVIASVPVEDGTVLVGGVEDPITNIMFNEDGTPTGLGGVDKSILIAFDAQNGTQEIELDFGPDGGFNGLTQFGSQNSVVVDFQDGYSDGELANLSVENNGDINGFYTNGQTRLLAQLGIATFANDEGLAEAGGNMFVETSNSGAVSIGEAGTLGRGVLVSGVLESSNVDTAEQFVRLIEAQRGFQANARVITTQDEVLAEVVNLI